MTGPNNHSDLTPSDSRPGSGGAVDRLWNAGEKRTMTVTNEASPTALPRADLPHIVGRHMSDATSTVRDRILQAAHRLFMARGFNGSNLRDIAKEAQVSMGGIYHHFASKEEIYETLLPATELAQHLPKLTALFRAPEFPENLSAIGRAIFDMVRTHKDDFKLVYIDILEFQARNIKPMIDALYGAFVQSSDVLLHRDQDQRSLRDIHPAIFTRSIIALFLHFYLESVMLEQSLADDIGLSEDEIADQMATLLLHGIMATPPALVSQDPRP